MADKDPLTVGLMSSTLAANHRLPPPPYRHTRQLQSRLTDAARGVRQRGVNCSQHHRGQCGWPQARLGGSVDDFVPSKM
jgi:hypothetical protein